MVDLSALTDKAKDLVVGNADKIEDVVDKVADFAGDKLGSEKVDPVREKVKSLIPRGEPAGSGGEDPAAEA